MNFTRYPSTLSLPGFQDILSIQQVQLRLISTAGFQVAEDSEHSMSTQAREEREHGGFVILQEGPVQLLRMASAKKCTALLTLRYVKPLSLKPCKTWKAKLFLQYFASKD